MRLYFKIYFDTEESGRTMRKILFDLSMSAIYLFICFLIRNSGFVAILNFFAMIFVVVWNGIVCAKRAMHYFYLLFASIAFLSIAKLTVNIYEPIVFPIVVCGVLSFIIIWLFAHKRMNAPSAKPIIMWLIVAAMFLGQFVWIDSSNIKTQFTVECTVQEKVQSGRFGFYDYSLLLETADGKSIWTDVEKKDFMSVEQGSEVTLSVNESCLGYHYYFYRG